MELPDEKAGLDPGEQVLTDPDGELEPALDEGEPDAVPAEGVEEGPVQVEDTVPDGKTSQ